MCYVVFGVVCLVCSVVVFCVVSQNKEETAECGTTIYICIITNAIGSLNIFVVFTVKNLTFSYSDFMLFCDFRSIVLI